MHSCVSNGVDLDFNIFSQFLEFKKGFNGPILLSGGEPTLHPYWHEFAEHLLKDGHIVYVLSNGLFLDDENEVNKVRTLLQYKPRFDIQITHDNRYYPKKINYRKARNLGLYVTKEVTSIIPIGRAKNFVTKRGYSSCINPKLIKLQRPNYNVIEIKNTMVENRKYCFPLITPLGDIHVGETIECFKIGTIYNTVEQIGKNIENISCEKCGLKNLK
jgi:organic radical activating enzyme